MITKDEIEKAGRYVEKLRLSVHELDVPNNNRTRAAGSCFSIAQEHHHAIVRLIEWKLFAAAFALVRSEFEAYVRGEWLSHCASDTVVEAFLQSKEPPKIDCLLSELEMLNIFNGKTLLSVKGKSWKSMCAYAHTGGLHVQRWNTADGIEANYARDEVLEILMIAEVFASLAVIGIARLAGNDELAGLVFEAFKKQVD